MINCKSLTDIFQVVSNRLSRPLERTHAHQKGCGRVDHYAKTSPDEFRRSTLDAVDSRRRHDLRTPPGPGLHVDGTYGLSEVWRLIELGINLPCYSDITGNSFWRLNGTTGRLSSVKDVDDLGTSITWWEASETAKVRAGVVSQFKARCRKKQVLDHHVEISATKHEPALKVMLTKKFGKPRISIFWIRIRLWVFGTYVNGCGSTEGVTFVRQSASQEG
ncbi:uncharacterized protein EDB91DRAFT_1078977 [Suillus paluster]|uniref:uncharacterized protein n=1 Tax=Suillus paluster TaxID=48578 RepID=UPI001B86F1C8|nr:uncharacterized protein EDB91DRAFT_1078977 [Suillus paluster]KAG1748831.1 hypothetical protein EDB91DRAFT_1078977 [Suillus paluster]